MPKKIAALVLTVILLLSAWHVYNLRNLRFDYNFENFLPVGDEDLSYYRFFKDNFTTDNDYLLIGLERKEGILDSSFLRRVQLLTKDLQGKEAVRNVFSPTTAGASRLLPDGNLLTIPWLRNKPSQFEADSIRILRNEPLSWPFVNPDFKSLSLIADLYPPENKSASDAAVDSVYASLRRYGFTGSGVHVAGKARAQKHYVALMQTEMPKLLGVSVIIVLILLFMLYRNVWCPALPMTVVALTALWVVGFMAWTGIAVDIMMVAIPSIIFVIATSDVIHLLTRYLAELRQGKTILEALKTAYKHVGLATLLTSVTTAAGFLTLLTASIRPIRSFGIVVAAGVAIAFFLAFTLLPALLYLLPKPSFIQASGSGGRWQSFMDHALTWCLRHKRFVLLFYSAVLVVSFFGARNIENNSYLISDLPAKDPLSQDFRFFDEHYRGSRTFEATITLPDTSEVYDRYILNHLKELDKVYSKTSISIIASPLLLAKATNQAIHGGDTSYFAIPEDSTAYHRFSRYIDRAARATPLKLKADSGNVYRISGRIRDIGSKETLKEADLLSAIEYIEPLNARLTGTTLLIDKNNEYLIENMVAGLVLAFTLVALIAGIMYKSFKMAIIALIPNFLPLIITAAVMGFAGISLRLSTSVIFTIAFGIAVDDTLHFLSKYRLLQKKDVSPAIQLIRTYRMTGKAIVVTTLLLGAGFLTFLFSNFGAIYYMGMLVSVTLISAMFTDMTLLPVILHLIAPKRSADKDA